MSCADIFEFLVEFEQSVDKRLSWGQLNKYDIKWMKAGCY